jgi:type IV secretory pathway TraG/TraD family ATPase VirD4
VYETARTAAQCLRDPAIMAWVTPPTAGLAEFTAAGFATSTDTLYLLSKDGAGAAAPLVAALTDRVMRAGVRAAERRGGRLDPPLTVVLDEAANVCRIADLPDLYSHLGSRGIVPVTILQSYRQGVRVWGEPGMDALWSASTVKLIGAGIDDARLAEDISRLVGDHDIVVESHNTSRHGGSRSRSLRTQRILTAAQVRALGRGTALLLATGAKPALVQLHPWYTTDRRDQITSAVKTAEAGLTARAARVEGSTVR